jgi:ATP-binding cassette, subfamily B, bacterial MsbA
MSAQAIRSLLAFTRPYPWAVPSLVGLSLLASLVEGIGIGLMIPLLDVMLGTGSSIPSGPLGQVMQQIGSFASSGTRLAMLAAAILTLIALKTVVMVANAVVAARITGRVTHDLRVGLTRQLLRVSYEFFSRSEHGRLMNVLEAQTYRTSEAMTLLAQLLSSLCAIVVFTLLLLLLSWKLAIVVIAMAVPVSLLVRGVTRWGHRYGTHLVEAYSALAGRMLELLSAMRTIRVFGEERGEERRMRAASNAARGLFVRTEALSQSIQPVVEFLYVPVFLAVLTYAWHAGIPTTSLLTFLLLLFRMQPQLKRLDYARVTLAGYAAGVAEVESLLRSHDKPYLSSGSVRLESLQREIEFDRVSFRYTGENAASVSDVSMRIPKGSVFAIVGGSGAGKSTLVSLLCRLYDPTEGTVRVDGIPLTQLQLESWRQRIAFAGQDAELLTGTIRDSIVYGAPSLDDEEVACFAQAAHADEFIRLLPEGYATRIGSRGMRLSGGQRQRIALARALARRPDVLILDEATNAVDNITETAIQETIEKLAGQCTIIVIAHRLTNVQRADHVVVMSQGRVAEQGSPDELLKIGGALAQLYGSR